MPFTIANAHKRISYGAPPVQLKAADQVLAPITPLELVVRRDPAPYLWHRDGQRIDLHVHPGQYRAWQAEQRIVAILAGTQGGKTSFLPWLLYREIQRCGPGDYLAGTANYDIFKLKFLPALREVFEHIAGWGRYWAGDRIIELANPATGKFLAKTSSDPMWARIILRSAESGGGWESATAKAALLDEAGMDAFTVDIWQALRRRLALSQGRIFIGTTLYNLGWLKETIYDAALAGDPSIALIQFDSTENPLFPMDEYEHAVATMPEWKVNMFYRGRYARPAGMIYGPFDTARDVIAPFDIPDHWQRYVGLDFGGVNTCAVFFAEHPDTKHLYLYRCYHAGDRTASEHVHHICAGEPVDRFYSVGGSKSEGQWRREFARAGLPILPPLVSDIEVGISRQFAALKKHRVSVFRNDTTSAWRDEIGRYSREVDAAGEPLERIKDKETFHHMDATRYIMTHLEKGAGGIPNKTKLRATTGSLSFRG